MMHGTVAQVNEVKDEGASLPPNGFATTCDVPTEPQAREAASGSSRR